MIEAVQVMQETVDPRVGDKRPREEDESDTQVPPVPLQSYVVKQEPPTGPRISSGPAGSDMSNGTMQSNSAMSQSQMIEDGYDSLYIGDLQWVRSYSALWKVYADRLFMGPPSGRRMRTCARWPLALAYPLTTKTSRSQNTRSTARVKGALSRHAPFPTLTLYARSIAYVECGSPTNAAAIKEWFDNK